MKKDQCLTGLTRVRPLVAILLGACAMLASIRAEGATTTAGRGQVRPGNAQTTQTKRAPVLFEVRWLQSNIAMHNRMIKLTQAEIALTTSSTIKTFAQNLNTTLGLEVTRMQGWLKTWYNIAPPALGPAPARVKDPAVPALNSQDLLYVDQLICYEHSLIQLSLFAGAKATHAELKTFAKNSIVNGQSVLAVANAWQDLLIKIALEQYFQ